MIYNLWNKESLHNICNSSYWLTIIDTIPLLHSSRASMFDCLLQLSSHIIIINMPFYSDVICTIYLEMTSKVTKITIHYSKACKGM